MTVADSGVGMSAEELEVIFDEFVQSGSSVQRRKGSGLGLAISRRLCELMGGDLSATSKPGDGSVFTVRLPVDGR